MFAVGFAVAIVVIYAVLLPSALYSTLHYTTHYTLHALRSVSKDQKTVCIILAIFGRFVFDGRQGACDSI